MSDSYQTALSQIIRVLKTSPGAPTVENLLRLASIYKFETFQEPIENNLSRISIAGQILVIDIDFEEIPTQAKGQTRFHLHSVKLILANNEASFKEVSSITGESVLRNALTLNPDLGKFDLSLERLSTIDQHSVVEHGELKIDCFEFISNVEKLLLSKFGKDNVVINAHHEFCFVVLEKFKIYLVSDESMSTALYLMKNGELERSGTLDDVGFHCEFLHDRTLPVVKQPSESLIQILNESTIDLPTVDDTFKTKKHGNITHTIQIFPLFRNELVLSTGLQCGDIKHLVETIDTISKLEQIVRVVDLVKEKCTVVDKFAEMEFETAKLNEFLEKSHGGSASGGDNMDIDRKYIALTVSDDELVVEGTLSDICGTLSLSDPEFVTRVSELASSLEMNVL